MANEIRTTLVVEGKGDFGKVQADAQKFTAAVEKSAAKVEASNKKASDQIDVLGEGLKESAAEADKLGQAMGSVDKASTFGKGRQGVEKLHAAFVQLAKVVNTSALGGLDKMGKGLDRMLVKAKTVKDVLGRLGGGGHGGHGGESSGGGGHGHGKKSHGHGAGGAHEGAFHQGFLEGVMPGNLSRIIDRGPGAGRQAMGIMAGESLRGIASSPFVGMGGITGAAEALGGGILAAPAERALEQAHKAIAFEQRQAKLTPFLGGYGMTRGGDYQGAFRAAGLSDEDISRRQSAASAEALSRFNPGQTDRAAIQGQAAQMQQAAMQRHVQALAQKQGLATTKDSIFGTTDALTFKQRQSLQAQAAQELGVHSGGIAPMFMAQARDIQGHAVGTQAADKTRAAMEADRDRVRAETLERTVGPLQHAGESLGGMALPEAQQFIAQVAQAAGGTGADVAGQGMMRASIAAQSALGIDATTSGAFSQAGRVGGMAGGRAQGGQEGFVKAIESGMKLGLSGSELTSYMAQMAQGIKNWETTGIPLAGDSIGKLGMSLATLGGMGGQRAAVAAFNAGNSLQQIGTQGPTDATQLLAMRVFGGLKAGGGASNYFDAASNLQNLKDDKTGRLERGMPEMVRMTAGWGGAVHGGSTDQMKMGAMTVAKNMAKLGVNMPLDQALLAVRQELGEDLSPEEHGQVAAAYKGLNKQHLGGAAGLEERGRKTNEGVPEEEAKRENQELATGARLIPSVQNMEAAANATAQAFSSFSGALNSVTQSLNEFAHMIPGAAEAPHGDNLRLRLSPRGAP